jgi:hypothetical protein
MEITIAFKITLLEALQKAPRPSRASFEPRGVLPVRRSGNEKKRNEGIGHFPKPSMLVRK